MEDDLGVGASEKMARLLADGRDLEGLRARADAGDKIAFILLARLLVRRGALEELRARVDAGDRRAMVYLADVLAERGDLEELRTRADACDTTSSRGWPTSWPGAGT